MIPRLLLLALLAGGSLPAQLTLLEIPATGVEEPLGESIDFGSVPGGDRAEIRLRLRNIGSGAIPLERFRVTGAGFSLDGHPTLPYTVMPGSNVDFRTVFRPTGAGSYSGTLRINETYIMLFGSSPATVTVAVEERSAFLPLGSGDVVVFGRVEHGGSAARRFRLQNPARETLTVDVLETAGPEFRIEAAPAVPLTLAPGAALDFSVLFVPASAGIRRSALLMNDRSFVLEGVGLHPAYPTLEIHLDPQTPASGQQGTLGVRLAGASPASGAGQVTMEFEPSIEGAPDDPAVQFLSTAGRTVSFTVEQGEESGRFGDLDNAVFQTGATAGTIVFTAELGDQTQQASLVLPAAPVTIDTAAWQATATGLELTIKGFDNTRSASEVAFRFFDTSGQALTSGPLRVAVADAFRHYFSATQVGGVFSLAASFPIAGDITLLGAVEIEFTNTFGPSTVYRLALH